MRVFFSGSVLDAAHFTLNFSVSRRLPAIRRVPIAAFKSSLYIMFHRKLAISPSQACDTNFALTRFQQQREHNMKTTTFTGMLSSTERALSAAIAVTLSLATTSVIAAVFQSAAMVDSPTLIAMLGKVLA